MNHTIKFGPSKRRTFLLAVMGGLLTLLTFGCGGSSSDGPIIGGPYPVDNGGFLIQLSAEDLIVAFPDSAVSQNPVFNPAITQFVIYAFNSSNQVVASKIVSHVAGTAFNNTIEDLSPVEGYNIVLAGLDAQDNLVSAIEAPSVFPLAGGLQLLNRNNFRTFPGFVLP